jgi:hypothetical protein
LTPADPLAAKVAHPYKEDSRESIDAEQLDLGDWCAISGAAFSTGLGMQTSLGFSLLAGLANVRLGYWWYAAVDRPRYLPFLAAYRYVLAELMADFRGTEEPFWFLTDGGHFDNTGVYELIRRRVGIILLCDNGCDTDYRFQDLGNLARKVRTDFGAHLHEVSPDARNVLFKDNTVLAAYFGSARDFETTEGRKGKCALLYEIDYEEPAVGGGSVERSLLIVFKPNMISRAPIDVVQYAWAHPDFPNQTTLDQFFDEAQWESYRMLGECIAAEVLEPDALETGGWYAQLARPRGPTVSR